MDQGQARTRPVESLGAVAGQPSRARRKRAPQHVHHRGSRSATLVEIPVLLEGLFESFSSDYWDHTLGGWHVVLTEEGVVLAHAAVVPRLLVVAGRPYRTG
jgi:hypothetical protein